MVFLLGDNLHRRHEPYLTQSTWPHRTNLFPFRAICIIVRQVTQTHQIQGRDRLIGPPYRPHNCNSSLMLRENPEILSPGDPGESPVWNPLGLRFSLFASSLSVSIRVLSPSSTPSCPVRFDYLQSFHHHKFVIVRLWLPALSSAWPHHLCQFAAPGFLRSNPMLRVRVRNQTGPCMQPSHPDAGRDQFCLCYTRISTCNINLMNLHRHTESSPRY